jgi:hypothetical protein
LNIASNDPSTPLATVTLTGVASDPPVIGVTPTSVDSVLLEGSQEVQILTVNNTGNGLLDLSVSITSDPAGFVSVLPVASTVPAAGSLALNVTFDATGVPVGSHFAEIQISSNDPLTPLVAIPASLTVIGAPLLAVSGEAVELESVVLYTLSGAQTVHNLPIAVKSAGNGRLELVAEGDYGDSFETATVTVEGLSLGMVGGVGLDCLPATGTFTIPAPDMALLLADDMVQVSVQNSSIVDTFCGVNQHTVRLKYDAPIDLLDFGTILVNTTTVRSFGITNVGSADLTVSAITSDLPEFFPSAGSVTLPPGAFASVTVTFAPTAAGNFNGTLALTSNDTATPQFAIPLVGTAVEAPVIGVSPDALVSTLMDGQQEIQALTISNTGGSALDFSISALPADAVTVGFAGLSVDLGSGGPPPHSEHDESTSPGFFAGVDAAYRPRASSPTTLSCVTADPSTGHLYAQAYNGVGFYRYKASIDSWEMLSSARIEGSGACGATFVDGKIYTAYANNGSQVGVYDIATDQWTTLTHPLGESTANIASDGQRSLFLLRGGNLVRFDLATATTTSLADPPFDFDPHGGLQHVEGILYGLQGGGRSGFAAYDLDSDTWVALPPSPGGTVAGSAIDPLSGEFVACGPNTGRNLYRYSLASGIWRVSTLPFDVGDGGVAWLPGTYPGLYVLQGQAGNQMTQLIEIAASFSLFGTDAAGGNLYSIDPVTASATLVGSMGFPAPSLAVDPTTGTMYAGQGGGNALLYVVDPATGNATLLGDTGFVFAALPGLAFDSLGTLYASINLIDDGGTGGDTLARIDKVSGLGTPIGLYGGGIGTFGGPGGIEGIAFAPSGVLYGASGMQSQTSGNPSLFNIDPATGQATLIGPIVDAAGNPVPGGVVSLQFGPNGMLYGGTGRQTGNLVVIDPATATYTLVGNAVSQSLGGLALEAGSSGAFFLDFDPVAGSVPVGSSVGVDVLFDATTQGPGTFEAVISIANNDPLNPTVAVPASLTIMGIPDIAIRDPRVNLESEKFYATPGARTVHEFSLSQIPAADATVEVFAQGDFGFAGETATVLAEGLPLGSVGNVGVDCATAMAGFTLSASDLAALAVDGVVVIEIQNSNSVDALCAANRHTVHLSYGLQSQSLDFGTIFLGSSGSQTLVVENRGSDNLEIYSISSDMPGISVVPDILTILPSSATELAIHFSPPSAGAFSGTLTLESNDPDEPQLTVALAGAGLAPPVAEVAPTEISATAPPGSPTTETETLHLSNTGGSNLEWSLTVFQTEEQIVAAGTWVEQPKGYEGENGSGTVTGDRFGGPDGFGYVFKDSNEPNGPIFDWFDIAAIGTPVFLSGDDQNSGPVAIGFSFPFYGDFFDTLNISTNGWLSFTSNKTSFSNPDVLPNSGFSVPENLIAPFWDDLELNGAQRITTYSETDRFIVQYTGVDRFSSSADLTFQAILYRSGKIVFQYLSMTGLRDSATIGIQDSDKTTGLLVSHNEDYVSDHFSVELAPLADWASAGPTFGVIPPAGSTDVVVELNSATLPQGRFHAVVAFSTNDPLNGTIQVPVDFAVNSPPVADAGLDAVTECTSFDGAMVTLDGSASTDADSTPGNNDDIVAFEWLEDFGLATETVLGTGETLQVTLPLGIHAVTLRVTDSFDQTATDDMTTMVVDTTAPEISVSIAPEMLWPPNHQVVDITVAVTASDACSVPLVALNSATSNEADDAPGIGDGSTTGDIQEADTGTPDFEFKLRSERAGSGNGRIYTASYVATDGSNNIGTESGYVAVPHDQAGATDPVALDVGENASGTFVTWAPLPNAQSFNAIRGRLSAVETTDLFINLGPVLCVEANSDDESTVGREDAELPGPGEGFFYLVEYFDGLSSSYGSESAAKPRVAGPGACE